MNKIIGNTILFWGFLFALLAYVFDIILYLDTSVSSPSVANAALAFIMLQPLWYLFHYTVYVVSHPESRDHKCFYIAISPLFMAFMIVPVLPSFKRVYEWFTLKFRMSDNSKLYMFTLDNVFKIHVGV